MLLEKINIINLFYNSVKYNNILIDKSIHSGYEGYWLEKKMNIKHNNLNNPDIYGFEMKKDAKKITFGDFSASEYLFSKNKLFINNYNNINININRTEFIKFFGNKNLIKNRYSWSGSCFPKYNIWNYNGQIITLNENNDIYIYYSFLKDNRVDKNNLPNYLKYNNILIAYWNNTKLKKNINNKFNNNGFFICKKKNNLYNKISFGKSFDFDYFIDNYKKYNIILDSGMYDGNIRNYSLFRSTNNKFWNKLIIDEF